MAATPEYLKNYQKGYRKKIGSDTINKRNKEDFKSSSLQLKDHYIKKQLREAGFPIITKELIELKRMILLGKRLSKLKHYESCRTSRSNERNP